MDALRGIAVALVVFEHAIRFAHRNGFAVPGALDLLSDVLNPVRMPALAFLAGMLLGRSLAKGASRYIEGKARGVLWPFLLWSCVYAALLVGVGGTSGVRHGWGTFARIPVDPPLHMWFLRDLFLFFALAPALGRLPRPAVAAAALVLSGLAAEFTVPLDGHTPQLPRFLFLLAFFVLGDWAAAREGAREGTKEGGPSLAALDRPLPRGVALAVAALLVPVAWAYGSVRYQAAGAPLALAGIAVLALAARWAGRTRLSGPLAFLGRGSLVVYVLHWLVLALVVEAVGRLAPGLPGGAVVALGVAFGIGLPALAIPLHRRLGLGWLFVLPARAAPLAGPALPYRQEEGPRA
jgi:uncharacterized membrane protein YcfT